MARADRGGDASSSDTDDDDEEESFTPAFASVDAIKEAVARHGSAMSFAEVQKQTGLSLDCPFIFTVLVADPTIKINRKTCTIRIFPHAPFPVQRADEAAWFAAAQRGVAQRSLCTRGANVLKLRQQQGRAILVEDWVEAEKVWFLCAPRVPQLSAEDVDALMQ